MEHLCVDAFPHLVTRQAVILEVELKRPCMAAEMSLPTAALLND